MLNKDQEDIKAMTAANVARRSLGGPLRFRAASISRIISFLLLASYLSIVQALSLLRSRPAQRTNFAYRPRPIRLFLQHRRATRPSTDIFSTETDSGESIIESLSPTPPYESVRPPFYTPTQSEAIRSIIGHYTARDPSCPTSMIIRWHAMSRECPDLLGIPPSSVREIYMSSVLSTGSNGSDEAAVPPVLPLIDSYCFVPGDCIRGAAYGLRGVRGGSVITTPPLKELGRCADLGYVTYVDEDTGEATSYELGRVGENTAADGVGAEEGGKDENYSLLGYDVGQKAGKITRGLAEGAAGAANGADLDLVKLGGLTAIVLAGATAWNMIGHHMTVNVFWV